MRSDVGAPPSGFRTVSLIVSSLLLIALVAAIALAILDNPKSAIPQVAAVATETTSPTDTPPGPTDTPATESTDAVEVASETTPVETATDAATPFATTPAPTSVPPTGGLGEQRRVEPAGFAFRPAMDYSLEFAGDSVTLSAGERSDAAAALMLLRTETDPTLIDAAVTDLDGAFSSIVDSLSVGSELQSGQPEDVTVGGESGRAVDIINSDGVSDVAGRIVVARPDTDRLFLVIGFAPGAVWQESARADFDAIVDSVEFFPPVVTPSAAIAQTTPPSIPVEISATEAAETATPTELPAATATATPIPASPFGPQPEWRIASNGNFANQVAPMRDTVWAATDGGVVAWNKDSGGHVKFTTLDGLSANRALAAENCPLPGFGMLFATNDGLQVFDTQSGSWKTLNSASSPMSFDDVAALHCDVDNEVLIAAYARHGLDVFDVELGEWTHIGEGDGLEHGIIRDITVTDPRTIWLASQLGLTRYSDGESTLFNVDNSPMTGNAVTAIASNGDDAVWLATAGDLYRTNGEDWETFSGTTVTDSEFPNGSITGLAVADDGTVWVGSDQTQVCLFDPAAGSCAEFFSNEEGMAVAPLTSVRLDQAGDVFYTTAGAGVSTYDGEKWTLLFIEDEPVAGNRMRDLASIGDGSVWAATDSGVSQVRLADGSPSRFFTAAISPLLSQDVRVVQPVTEDSAWFGTAGGANLFQDSNWTSFTEADGLAGSDIHALAIDSQNRVWIGSRTGLSIWTGSAFFNLTTDNGLPSDDISSLLNAGDLVWIGTDKGLLRFQDNQLQVFNTGNIDLPSNVITALALDSDGSLLIGTEEGLARFRDNRMIAIPDIPAAPITSIAIGEGDAVWVAANEGELYHFDGNEWIPVTDLVLLPSPSISALYVDENGDLWIGSAEGGLAVVTP